MSETYSKSRYGGNVIKLERHASKETSWQDKRYDDRSVSRFQPSGNPKTMSKTQYTPQEQYDSSIYKERRVEQNLLAGCALTDLPIICHDHIEVGKIGLAQSESGEVATKGTAAEELAAKEADSVQPVSSGVVSSGTVLFGWRDVERRGETLESPLSSSTKPTPTSLAIECLTSVLSIAVLIIFAFRQRTSNAFFIRWCFIRGTADKL